MKNTIETSFPEFRLKKSEGLHDYLFHYACKCANEEIDPEELECHMIESAALLNYNRNVPDREIRSAIKSAYSSDFDGNQKNTHRRPAYQPGAAKLIAEEFGTTLEDLQASSPKTPPLDPDEALAALFGADELVCLAKKLELAKTLPFACWLERDDELKDYQFVVPHPMTSKKGVTKDGRSSNRTASNTGQRRRIVCDFDKPKPGIQPALIAHLADYCGEDPELVLTSGGKSLHAWWRIDHWPPEDIIVFEEEAARIGADPALLGEARKCQLVRLPAGKRNNGKPQSILFWNPKN
jgi:hypothetical protein